MTGNVTVESRRAAWGGGTAEYGAIYGERLPIMNEPKSEMDRWPTARRCVLRMVHIACCAPAQINTFIVTCVLRAICRCLVWTKWFRNDEALPAQRKMLEGLCKNTVPQHTHATGQHGRMI